jgi:hypothetical protein
MHLETLKNFDAVVRGEDGRVWFARAVGGQRADGMWEGFVEFERELVLRTERETTQPNRQDLLYWATGLEPVYLEGALARAYPVSRELGTAHAR